MLFCTATHIFSKITLPNYQCNNQSLYILLPRFYLIILVEYYKVTPINPQNQTFNSSIQN